jgi:hypothetical protein
VGRASTCVPGPTTVVSRFVPQLRKNKTDGARRRPGIAYRRSFAPTTILQDCDSTAPAAPPRQGLSLE